MKVLLKDPRLPKLLLAGSLLLVAVLGLLQLPEVGGRFFPDRFWQQQLDRDRWRIAWAKMEVAKYQALREVLLQAQREGLPALPGYAPPTAAGLGQALARTEVELQYAWEYQQVVEEKLERWRREKDSPQRHGGHGEAQRGE